MGIAMQWYQMGDQMLYGQIRVHVGMVLKEAAVYKMVDNFGNNCWIGMKF